MSEIFTTDNIALYGSIVSTLVMFITFGQLYGSIQDKKIRLKVSYQKHKDYDENIQNIGVKYDVNTLRVSGASGEAYVVTINNIGNINVYIKEIYGIALDGRRYDALIKQCASITAKEFIEPKSYKNYSIYFKEDSTNFEIEKCCVIDGNNKEWKAKKT